MTNPVENTFRTAVALQRDGEFDRAEALYRGLLGSQPDLKVARHNLIGLLRAQGRWAEAEAEMRVALARDPGDPDLQYDLAGALLASGDYGPAWPLYETRRRMSVDPVQAPAFDLPEWRGEPVRSLLVWGEQGFGDHIQFARYLPLLRTRGIAVTFVCKPGLERLFEGLDVTVIPARGHADIGRCDAWVLLGSLPLRFGTLLDSIPPGTWLEGTCLEGAKGGSGIGVVTRGQPRHRYDAHRSLPAAAAAELLALPGARSLEPADTGARDFAETAAIIRGLERVITVDTAVAHLAGAMGKPVWILLAATGVDWRWLRDRSDSPWYPSARLFRQRDPGDWGPVLDDVRRSLAAFGGPTDAGCGVS